ncbi:tape measure protein [Curtobacterium sp. MCSS17_015]|uniref:tape measure protein n=1 Tax=Curtobacterium sp. MCSS17_015 TaxID=2175666 RepID=UPI000DAA1342|nr:tape measure protein [Curtobacterium sp. MCSS17_015]WIB25431.1 tape measure protein [Curtobacterium sp. MCSS17_015]
MSEVAEATVPVFPTFVGFRSAVVSEADSAADSAGTKFGSRFGKGILGAAKGVAVGVGAAIATAGGAAAVGIGGIFKKGLDRALNIQDAKQQLDGLGHSAKSVETIMTNALASVKGTAFGLDTAATLAATVVAAGIKPGQELERTLKLTADAATIAKTGLGEMGDIIGKVASSGKLSTDVLNQFSQRGVPLLQFVAKEYGVTAEEASEMVSKGKVDFAGFQKALEAGVGGAALSSGATARGAFKNIGAAFGRLGAMFAQPAVNAAPRLFQSTAGAIDRAAAALTPYADAFAAKLEPALEAVSAKLDSIDFGAAVEKAAVFVRGVVAVIRTGVAGDGFSFDLTRAFGLDKAPVIFRLASGVRDAVLGVVDVVKILAGDTSDATAIDLSKRFGLNAAPTIYALATKVHDAVSTLFTGLKTGEFSGVGEDLGKVATAARPLFPLFVEVGAGLGRISGSIGGLIASGLPVVGQLLNGFAQVLDFLGDHPAVLATAIVALAAAFGVFKTGQLAANTASAASVALAPLQIAADLARTRALVANTNAMLANRTATVATSGATAASTLTRLPATASILANTASLVANRIAMTAAAVFQRTLAAAQAVATAAQWAFNVALSANPIGIVVLAIGALVAGLVWFFTQTKVGQAAWAAFTTFLSEAWTNIVNTAKVTWTLLVGFFSGLWANLTSFFSTWGPTILAVVAPFIGVPLLIAQNWDRIKAFFAGLWADVTARFSAGVSAALEFVRSMPGKALAALGRVGSILRDSGRALIGGFIDGIRDMIGKAGEVAGSVLKKVQNFFPHSPAPEGPFSGSGWRAVRTSGRALMDQFNGGISDSDVALFQDVSTGITGRRFGSGTTVPGGRTAADGPRVQVDVHTSPGMSEQTVGRVAGDAVNFELRRG